MSSADIFRTMLNTFDPKRPLEGKPLEDYYVERPHAPLESMKAYLRATDQHVKVLFGGHRGSGKSSELARLAEDLKGDFLVVPVSARNLNLHDLNYVDLALGSASALLRRVAQSTPQLKGLRPVLKEVYDWLANEIAQETTITKAKSGSVASKITAFVLSLEGKYARETATRETIRARLYRRLSDLIDRVNAVCLELERVGPPPLIIFEDIDKADLARARDLFFDHATTLNSLACRIIYTFPIPLSYANEFIEHRGDYSHIFRLSNIHVFNRAGQPDSAGRKALRDVIARRVQLGIFGKEALAQIIELSGGLMRDLIRIVADAALEALTRKSDKISLNIVRTVAAGVANDYRGVLLPKHYETLGDLRETKEIMPTDDVRKLLENLSLLEYRNDDVWCDVHPAVKVLLDSREKTR